MRLVIEAYRTDSWKNTVFMDKLNTRGLIQNGLLYKFLASNVTKQNPLSLRKQIVQNSYTYFLMVDSSIHATSARLKGIYREAKYLLNRGWMVTANFIPGYSSPPEIEGFTPDIYALKEDQTYILMVESMDDSDSERTTLFEKYASDFQNILFETCQVNAAGSRVNIS